VSLRRIGDRWTRTWPTAAGAAMVIAAGWRDSDGQYWDRSSTAVDSLPSTRDDFIDLLQAVLADALDQEGPSTTHPFRGGHGQELDKERSGSSSEARSVARLLRLVADALDPGSQP